ncbi:MAG: hypothetical protein ABSB58_07955, partial [Gemmatimonadales bacterium]
MARPLIALALLSLLSANRLAAQQPDTLAGVRRPRLRQDTLRLVLPAELAPLGRLAALRPDAARVAREWAAGLRARLARQDAVRWRAMLLGGDTSLAGAPPGAPA